MPSVSSIVNPIVSAVEAVFEWFGGFYSAANGWLGFFLSMFAIFLIFRFIILPVTGFQIGAGLSVGVNKISNEIKKGKEDK